MDTWPDKMEVPLTQEIEKAMEGTACFIAWPEGEAFCVAHQPREVARKVIEAYHPHLLNANIAYLFRENMKRRGGSIWGTAERVGSKWYLLSQVDFVITLNWKMWHELTYPQRAALLDHELEHCGHNDESNSWEMQPHDLEEFNTIVARWGPWRASVANFGHVLAPQLDLALT